MTMSNPRPVLHVPARDIPVPTSVSAEAQAVLAMPPMPAPDYPAVDDLDGWHEMIAGYDKTVGSMVSAGVDDAPVTTEEFDVDGVRVYDIRPFALARDDDRIYLDIHGGAFIHGAGETCRAMGIRTAIRLVAHVWAVDYRMPPDHPFPDGLDDCVAVYRALLEDHRPDTIVIGGASAGGNLTAAAILRAREEGLPLPAAAVLMTPAVDLTESGDSLRTNLGLDPLIQRSGMPASLVYAAGRDLADPYLSPLFGDFTKGFPPTVLTTGTRDMLLSDTVRMHRALRAADVPAQLHVTEAGGHGGFFGMAPEDEAINVEIRRFIDAHSPRVRGHGG
jgi:acetyl esterase/lipase